MFSVGLLAAIYTGGIMLFPLLLLSRNVLLAGTPFFRWEVVLDSDAKRRIFLKKKQPKCGPLHRPWTRYLLTKIVFI